MESPPKLIAPIPTVKEKLGITDETTWYPREKREKSKKRRPPLPAPEEYGFSETAAYYLNPFLIYT